MVVNAQSHLSPHKKDPLDPSLIRLIEEEDVKSVIKKIKKGNVGLRRIFLGACVRQGDCEYGGWESVASCGGGIDGAPCKDLRVSLDRKKDVQALKEKHLEDMKTLDQDSVMYNAKKAEVYAIEVYENVIKKQKG
jgi:hypothetical protein